MNLQDYLDVSLSTDKSSFERRLIEFAQRMDFGLVSGALIIEKPGKASDFVQVGGNTPKAFVEARMKLDDSTRDPVLKRLKQLSVPFAYDQQMYVDDGDVDLWDLQASYGYRTGIALAPHMPEGKHFVLGVDRDQPLPESTQLVRLMADLQLFAVYAQSAATRLFTPNSELVDIERPRLTAQEIDVLRWTMRGKSAAVIGDIMGLSRHGINYHLRNIMRKLDCTSKHQAVFKAVALGLIS